MFLKLLDFLIIPIVIVTLGYGWHWHTNSNKGPPLSSPHNYRHLRNFIEKGHLVRLRQLFEELKTFPAAKGDQTNFVYTHIGEAEEPNQANGCSKTYLVYNPTLKKCVFPSRVDIGRHFVTTGGYEGWKEKLETVISRSTLFINYQFNPNDRSEFKELFELKGFQDAVNEVCVWYDKPYFRPFQLSMILLTPGQAVPAHLDVPYFEDATRYIFPQWLLLVMQESGLFRELRIPQVQAIVYVHEDEQQRIGGDFIAYPQGPGYEGVPLSIDSGVGIFCDGSEMVHASSTFQPHIPPLSFDKDAIVSLDFDASTKTWQAIVNKNATGNVYKWNEIRASVAYRGWCFKDKEEADKFDPKVFTGKLTLDMVIDRLTQNLISKGLATSETIQQLRQPNTKDRNYAYELGLLLLDNYIKLPFPQLSYIPYNYCLIFKLFPHWKLAEDMEQLIC